MKSPAVGMLVLAAQMAATLALSGCSRGEGMAQFATNLRDRVAGDAAAAAAARALRPSPAETGGSGSGRPRPKAGQPAQPGQPGQPGDQNATADGALQPYGGPGSPEASAPPQARPPVIYYYPTTPTPAAPSQ